MAGSPRSAQATPPNSRRRDRGFTLVELLLVIVVLGVLAAIVIFALGGTSARAAVAACRSDAKSVAIAVRAFMTENADTPPSSLSTLAASPDPYLASLPSSPYYSIALGSHGSVTVTAPPVSGSARLWTDPLACAGAALASTGTTVGSTAATTTSTTTPPTTSTSTTTSTTTTSTTTTTTTTTTPPTTTTTQPDNGVSATSGHLGFFGSYDDYLSVSNTSSVTAMTVTVNVSASGGETYSRETSGYRAGTLTMTHSLGGGEITYTFSLAANHTIAARSRATLTAYFTLAHGTHSSSADTWSITSTSGGTTATISGSF